MRTRNQTLRSLRTTPETDTRIVHPHQTCLSRSYNPLTGTSPLLLVSRNGRGIMRVVVVMIVIDIALALIVVSAGAVVQASYQSIVFTVPVPVIGSFLPTTSPAHAPLALFSRDNDGFPTESQFCGIRYLMSRLSI